MRPCRVVGALGSKRCPTRNNANDAYNESAYAQTESALSPPPHSFYPHSNADITENTSLKLFTLNAGLYSGLSGLIYFQKELTQRVISNGAKLSTVMQALDKYLIATDSGYRVLGDCDRRYSADVWSGSSSIIRCLDALIRGARFQYLPLSSERILKTWLEDVD
jgi:hypothetical protein